MYAEEDYLMLSGIQHFAFCRRRWAIIHIEQQWADNAKTTAGELMHKKAHDEGSFEKRGSILIVRGMRVSSRRLGLSGQCDVVEFYKDEKGIVLYEYEDTWKPIPVEYKHGAPNEYNADELQLCAQAVCLEEMLQTEIPEGYLYYGEHRRRSRVEFTDVLREETRRAAKEMHELFQRGHTPNVKPSKKCTSCSLKDICVPKLQKAMNVREYIRQSINADS